MNKDSKAQYFIFTLNMILILFFSYHAIPGSDMDKFSDKISKKRETKIHMEAGSTGGVAAIETATTGHGETDDSHSSAKASAPEEPEKTDTPAKTAPAETAPAKTVAAKTVAAEAEPDSKPKDQQKKAEPASGSGDGNIDIIAMNNPLYKAHKKGIVQFTHKKHVEDYAISCGSCHHDDMGKPLDLKPDDKPESCIACHKETQKVKGEKLGKKEKIAKYHMEAIHANCVDCHKEVNIEKGDPKGKKGPAPVSCGKCHPKTKK